MKKLVLERFASTQHGVIGRIGQWYTLEEEDLNNTRNISCIPAGMYECKRSFYSKGGYPTFWVTSVPGRSNILFHKGNTEEDTQGCILLGKELGALMVKDEDNKDMRTPKIAVLKSGQAFDEFMKFLEGTDRFELQIIWI